MNRHSHKDIKPKQKTKNRNLKFVIPAQAGIWNFNASRIYRKKPKPFRRHSHESGNLEMKSSR
ncbi:hypothetical protein, partial [Neisseria meningitidis]|uniref:hypothetical protein n=2 Tax=Neisseria meningitidis TaxID=487 RepID=UPI001E5237FA